MVTFTALGTSPTPEELFIRICVGPGVWMHNAHCLTSYRTQNRFVRGEHSKSRCLFVAPRGQHGTRVTCTVAHLVLNNLLLTVL